MSNVVSLLWVKPEIRQTARYSNATFRSLYGAVVIALLRGLAGERQMDEDVKAFAPPTLFDTALSQPNEEGEGK